MDMKHLKIKTWKHGAMHIDTTIGRDIMLMPDEVEELRNFFKNIIEAQAYEECHFETCSTLKNILAVTEGNA